MNEFLNKIDRDGYIYRDRDYNLNQYAEKYDEVDNRINIY